MIRYYCSDGSRISEAGIKAKLSKAYKDYYLHQPMGACEGCGKQATCTAHIVPKSQCKVLGKTEMIWSPVNWYRSCYICNQVGENTSQVHTLLNYKRILEVTRSIDEQRYNKMLYAERLV